MSLQALPSIDRLLRVQRLTDLRAAYRHEVVVWLLRDVLDGYRTGMRAGSSVPCIDEIADHAIHEAERRWGPARPVINATGVILHTNLGRAPLSPEAIGAMADAAAYSALEYDLASGDRGSRQTRVGELLRALTGAEASHVTVNNASAVLLALTALARGREVIVSRGQAVEIGGGFRVPAILRQSGARLVDVGTTNRTTVDDYREALSPRTGALLQVHPSNFRVVGYTAEVGVADLVQLGRERGVPVIVDNGSGALIDTAEFGIGHEPTPQEALQAGADVVAFSADKLVGGPQAGILLGRQSCLTRIESHPLSRALRPDKVTLAGLAATLMAYMRGDAVRTLPLWQMIAQTEEGLRARSESWAARAREHGIRLEMRPGESTVGGGSLPGETLPTTLLIMPRGMTVAHLRAATPAVVARTSGGRVVLDLRTVEPGAECALLLSVVHAFGSAKRVVDSSRR